MVRFVVCLLALAVLAPLAGAQTLDVGSNAPALTIEKWVKGDAVTLEKGKVYVVEFWATWCGPCVASMPHLSELQDHYGDKVTFIGVTKPDATNTLAKVEQMVEEKGPGMGYTVAWDGSGKTYADFMTAAGKTGIPTSFVVGADGKVAYIGHPAGLDLPLSRIVAGTWDPVGFEEEAARLMQDLRDKMIVAQTDPKAGVKVLDDFVNEHPDYGPMLQRHRMQLLFQGKMWDEYYAALAKDVEKGIKYRNPQGLNSVAWGIVDPKASIGRRDVELALKAADKAVAFTKGEDAAIVDTLARCWFLKGEVQKAIELQRKAVGLQENAVEKAKAGGNERSIKQQEEMLQGLVAALKEYQGSGSEKGEAEEPEDSDEPEDG